MMAAGAIFRFFLATRLGQTISVALVCLTVGGIAGGRTVARVYHAREMHALRVAYEARIKRMNAELEARDAAASADQARATEAESQRLASEERANALEARISSGPGFVGADADRVRDLWNGDAPRAKRSTAAGAR